jgi:hypothetical protein
MMMSHNNVAYATIKKLPITRSIMSYIEYASTEDGSNEISTNHETQTGLNVTHDRIQSRTKNSNNGYDELWLGDSGASSHITYDDTNVYKRIAIDGQVHIAD